MSRPAIRVEGLWKQYLIGERERNGESFREALTRSLLVPFRWIGAAQNDARMRTVWALQDVSFAVEPGEVVGVIGRNGAGKTTLLKVLSKITFPTRGRVEVIGRLGSLLEVGTGFHPELTGRENIFINGSILGMRRAHIRRKFDEIVAFAEVEEFLDTPVKRYSTGMGVRLAFSIAAHLEPDILLVDEVLAVGDAAFRRKCLGRMGSLARTGRTVVFVSHSMDAVQTLCSRVVLLDRGRVVMIGPAADIVRKYLEMPLDYSDHEEARWCTPSFRILGVRVFGQCPYEPIVPLGRLTIEVDVVPLVATRDVSVQLLVHSGDGRHELGFDSVDWGAIAEQIGRRGVAQFTLDLPQCPLPPGTYSIELYVKSYSNQTFERVDGNMRFSVLNQPVYGYRMYDARWHGRVLTGASMQAKIVSE
jgi:lipopolysaccharide transport system ATP-binding protein